jgi:hypothetical protein
MKRLFIGHFGGKLKEDWFFSWAENEEEAIKTIQKEFGEPEFIEDVTDISSGGFCFKPINISDNTKPYYLFELFQDDFKFVNDNLIQEIIYKQISIDEEKEDQQREEYRKLIEEENIKQKNSQEEEYNKIKEEIDNLNL